MKKPEVFAETPDSDLEGLPGIGAVRRAALAVAGITTRAAFALATVDQLISITGIQRAYAVKALDAARTTLAQEPSASVPPADETTPNGASIALAPEASEPTAPESEPPIELDLAIAKATTALADASRRYSDSPALLREFIRLAKLLERLSGFASAASKKRKSRIANRLDKITARLEKAAARSGKPSKSVAEKLREALRNGRDRIVDIVSIKASQKPKANK